MGSTNWTELDDDLDLASLDRGVTTAIPRPNGGGSFIFAFNSLVTDQGAAGYFTNQANFAPTNVNKGGSVRGAIQRGVSAGAINFAPLLYICGQGSSVNDSAYILGLQDDSPHRIALRKGTIVSGIPSASPGASGILKRSTATFTPGTWHHLRLDAVVNLNGDVILKAFYNDLVANAVTAPVWSPIPGIEDATLAGTHGAGTAFVDDALGILSGSAPFTNGRMGFAFFTKDVSRRGYFDHIECIKQD
jgi:hypothetical protein